jgi:hypothetical protein
MAHNVPAVYDVLPARIRACEARPGLAKCGWSEPWEWSEAERPRRTEPRSDRRERSIYRPVMRSFFALHNFLFIFVLIYSNFLPPEIE